MLEVRTSTCEFCEDTIQPITEIHWKANRPMGEELMNLRGVMPMAVAAECKGPELRKSQSGQIAVNSQN